MKWFGRDWTVRSIWNGATRKTQRLSWRKSMARSVFETGTGKTATVAALAGLIVAIAPNISGILARKYPDAKADIEDTTSALVQVLGLVTVLSGGAAVANRASAKDRAFSPSWLPGFNKEDCVKPLSVEALPKPDMHEQVAKLASQQFAEAKRIVQNPQDAI
jgi:hypothetical protein